MTASYRFKVNGRVQGVFFRKSTAETATRLGLSGWVRNCPDGSVEGHASGTSDAVEQLRKWLHQGPPTARVDAVQWEATEPEDGRAFEVRR